MEQEALRAESIGCGYLNNDLVILYLVKFKSFCDLQHYIYRILKNKYQVYYKNLIKSVSENSFNFLIEI